MVPLGSLQAFLGWGSVPQSGQLALLVELGAAVYHWASARPLCLTDQFNAIAHIECAPDAQIAHSTGPTHVRLRNLRKVKVRGDELTVHKASARLARGTWGDLSHNPHDRLNLA